MSVYEDYWYKIKITEGKYAGCHNMIMYGRYDVFALVMNSHSEEFCQIPLEFVRPETKIELNRHVVDWKLALKFTILGLRFGFQHPGIQRLQVN